MNQDVSRYYLDSRFGFGQTNKTKSFVLQWSDVRFLA